MLLLKNASLRQLRWLNHKKSPIYVHWRVVLTCHIVYGRFNGQPSRSERPPTNSALDRNQEQALIRWIRQLDDLYIPPTPKLVEQQASEILQHQTDASQSVSKMWAY